MKKSNQYLVFIVLLILIIAVIGYISLFQEPSSSKSASTQTWEQLTVSSVESMKVGKAAEAEQRCNQAMKLLREADIEDIRMVKTYMLMGEIYRSEKKNDLAEESFINAVNICKKIYGTNHPDMVIPLESLANFYYFTKIDYHKVATLYEQILEITQSKTGNDNEVAIRANNLAIVYRLLDQYAKAEPLYKKILILTENKSDSNKADLIQYLMMSADFYRAWDKCDQSETLAKRALDLRENMSKKTSGVDAQLDLAICLDGLGQIYLSCGKARDAEIIYMRSYSIIEKIMGVDHPDLGPRLAGLAAALSSQKKYQEAWSQYKRAVKIMEKSLGPDCPEVAPILEQYAALLYEMKKTDEAKAMFARADSIRKRTLYL